MWKRIAVIVAAAGLGGSAITTASGAAPAPSPAPAAAHSRTAEVLVPGRVPAPSAGTSDDRGGRPHWVPYHQQDFAYAAGEACRFGVSGHVVRDREFSKDVAFDPDGTLITQLFKGPLVIRYTNRHTGKHIRVNQSGRAIETFDGNGEFVSLLVRSGHFGTALPAGSGLPKGLYRIGGRWSSVSINDDGTRTVGLGPFGTAQNLCHRLSGPAQG